jgi:sRNA-binding carbon storage regulator CsrA
MLILSRKNDESVVVGADDDLVGTAKVTVLELSGGVQGISGMRKGVLKG